MSCNYPVSAFQIADQQERAVGIVFQPTEGMNVIRNLLLPCGQCDGCRAERARQWTARIMHEAKMYEENCFITLTYNDDHLPDENNLQYEDFQKFMKRLRKKLSYPLKSSKHHGPRRRIRFFVCGEYGEKHDRPHFHACMFNISFPDMVFFKKTPKGSVLYTSEILNRLWTDNSGSSMGFTTIGALTPESASYTAQYIMEKGRKGSLHYQYIDLETGEVSERTREFVKMSLKPGIGREFYEVYHKDIYPHDIVVINGIEQKPPTYYNKRLKVENPELHEQLSYKRMKKAQKYAADNTPQRREDKEKVLIEKRKFYSNRNLI